MPVCVPGLVQPDLRDEHALVNDNTRRSVLLVLLYPPNTLFVVDALRALNALAQQRRRWAGTGECSLVTSPTGTGCAAAYSST
jgi:hypothetical protein